MNCYTLVSIRISGMIRSANVQQMTEWSDLRIQPSRIHKTPAIVANADSRAEILLEHPSLGQPTHAQNHSVRGVFQDGLSASCPRMGSRTGYGTESRPHAYEVSLVMG
jgi:hypothetical protein